MTINKIMNTADIKSIIRTLNEVRKKATQAGDVKTWYLVNDIYLAVNKLTQTEQETIIKYYNQIDQS